MALSHQAKLAAGQSILTLDGYHVGADWVIGLDYDEDSQAGQGALSHRIRLDELTELLAEQQPKLTQLEGQLPELQNAVQALQQNLQQQHSQLKNWQKDIQNADVAIAKVQSSNQAFALQKQQLPQKNCSRIEDAY